MARQDNVPLAPGAKSPGKSKSYSSTAVKGAGGGGSKSGGGGGGGKDPYAAALANQKKSGKANQKSLLKQAKLLKDQAASLKLALSEDGFRAALEQRLRNIDLDLSQQEQVLMEGYNARLGALQGAASDNEKAAGDDSAANIVNRARERSNAVGQALSQGAGESDLLRSEQMSLRNWDANQGEINRSFFDTLRSVNSSLTDLNTDTKTGRANLYLQAGDDREQAWTNFYNQKGETFTQLGNIYGQASSTYGQAGVFGAGGQGSASLGKKGKKGAKTTMGLAKNAFDRAAEFAGKAYQDPGVPAAIMGWQGADQFEGKLSSSTYTDLGQTEERKKPEGATLRSWT